MSVAVEAGSDEGRILALLVERERATDDAIAVALGLRTASVQFALRRLRARGLVVTEELGGRTYATLSGQAFTFVGRAPRDTKRATARAKPAPPRDENDPAFM